MVELKVKFLKNVGEKSIGLIGKAKPAPIMFLTRFGIHTFGLKFPIDVIILDSSNKVVKIKKSLKQNRIFLWNIKYNCVIELPNGQVDEKRILLGQKIKLDIVNR